MWIGCNWLMKGASGGLCYYDNESSGFIISREFLDQLCCTVFSRRILIHRVG
jgi:hypothetical protein